MRYPIPAVRLIVTDETRRVLILKRDSTVHAPGSWCLPGGKVEYGDTVEQTIHAELREETGLECGDSRFLFYQDSLPLNPGEMHCINLYFECTASGTITLNDESSSYAWIDPLELESFALAFRNDHGLRRYWEEDSSERS